MGMPAPQTVSTIEQLLALPYDGMRHELLDGEHAVTPAPSWLHQEILARLYDQLRPAVGESDAIALLWSPADIHLGPRTLVQPDLFIARRPAAGQHAEWKDVPVPLLVVEVLSTATAARDRGNKRRIYLDAGVEEYWIVDIDARLIERWRTGDRRPEMVDAKLCWELSVGVAGTVEVPALFR
jgi:Uma2 family endonuclease